MNSNLATLRHMAGRTTQDRIERFADSIDAKLRADEESGTSMKAFTRSKVREVLRRCGFDRRGDQNLRRIEAALRLRGVFPDPPLTTPGLDREDSIHFTRSPEPGRVALPGARFKSERDLETFLVDNFGYLFPGLKLVRRQYPVQRGKVDILAKDPSGYVVIELKRGRPDEGLVRQIVRYMDDVADWAARKGEDASVRGIVVSEHVDRHMHDLLSDIAAVQSKTIDWLEYRIECSLDPVDGGVTAEA